MADINLMMLAKYPFHEQSKEYVTSLGLSIAQMREHPIYGSSFELGTQRATQALENKLTHKAEDKISAELSILSFAIARILVNLTRNKSIIRRYAKAEAQMAHALLLREKPEIIENIKTDVGLRIQDNKISYTQYVHYAKELAKTNPRWKLVNRRMHEGIIGLNKAEQLIIMQEAIQQKIATPINVTKTPHEFKQTAENINLRYSGRPTEISMKELELNALPPCIKQIIAQLESGNASHNSMFVLATTLIDLGLKTENILKIFSRYPSYNEEKSRYQIEFLAGEKSTTRYSSPTCARIKGYGLCVAECKIKHPLMYYRDRKKR